MSHRTKESACDCPGIGYADLKSPARLAPRGAIFYWKKVAIQALFSDISFAAGGKQRGLCRLLAA
jgi:hypothetical protein